MYRVGMPRAARVAPGGMVFHVLNRGNDRRDIFDDRADYEAFLRVMDLEKGISPIIETDSRSLPGRTILKYA